MIKVKYLIDFDDVLFDRRKFWNALINIMKSEGIEKDFSSTYRDPEVYKNGGYGGVENHLNHIAFINSRRSQPIPYNYDRIKQKVGVLLSDLRHYLFPEALSFLSSIDCKTYDIYLITVGNRDFQKLKVVNSGVADLFQSGHIIYTESPKEDELKNLVGETEYFSLLEDKPETVKAVRENFPNAFVMPTSEGNLIPYVNPVSLDKSLKEQIA